MLEPRKGGGFYRTQNPTKPFSQVLQYHSSIFLHHGVHEPPAHEPPLYEDRSRTADGRNNTWIILTRSTDLRPLTNRHCGGPGGTCPPARDEHYTPLHQLYCLLWSPHDEDSSRSAGGRNNERKLSRDLPIFDPRPIAPAEFRGHSSPGNIMKISRG